MSSEIRQMAHPLRYVRFDPFIHKEEQRDHVFRDFVGIPRLDYVDDSWVVSEAWKDAPYELRFTKIQSLNV